MQRAAEQSKTELLDRVISVVDEKWPAREAPVLQCFIRQYYRRVAAEDLYRRQPGDVYGAALSHWNLGRRRKPGLPRIHVYNPTPDQHGWESTHTIVQIVTDDLPFLVDSIAMAMNRQGLTIHLTVHPLIQAKRDSKGEIREVYPDDHLDHAVPEAWMHFELDRLPDQQQLDELQHEISQVLGDCRTVVNDWQPMRETMRDAAAEMAMLAPEADSNGADRDEALAFLNWLIDNNFTFLGYRRYALRRKGKQDDLSPEQGSGLGILRKQRIRERSDSFSNLPEAVRAMAREPTPLIVTKSNHRATVHRPGYLDYIGVKRFNAQGEVIGEHRFLGLYTSAAYNRNPREIPLLRRKISTVLERSALPHPGHASKALINILETYPRDELFQADPDTLEEIATGILHLQDRQRVRLFVRHDPYQRFVSCLVYAPRERYDSDVRRRMTVILEDAYGTEQSEFTVSLSEAVLARIHFILHIAGNRIPDVDTTALEGRLARTIRDWSDDLQQALLDYYGEAHGNRLFKDYGRAFGAAYREDTAARAAAQDVERLEHLRSGNDLEIMLYRPLEAPDDVVRLRLYHHNGPITLSDALPLLENMGVLVLDERPYGVHLKGAVHWIHDFGLQNTTQSDLEVEQIRDLFEQAFDAAWHGQVENDGFNRLVLAARLSWREIVIVRAYCRYLRQAGTAFSQTYMEETLVNNPRITRLLVRLFHTRLDPEREDAKRAARIGEQVELALNEVPSLDEDRILRRLLAAIQATLRTNYYQTDSHGELKAYLSLKLNPEDIPAMPQPRPAFEIYVYSPRTEGVHLRGGKIARGGLRWSDRKEDYRTEVLGLMKAQMVKNAVIVPVGAKGGFVAKQLPEARAAMQEEVKACYRIFIRGLLDLTDNHVGGEIHPPGQVVRHDEDDPYLVVAADKGTATFSDLANEIAAEYDFWLKDAFASGGSNGYDHKKMGITARGAWVAVERHFREMNHDIRTTPFTVAGIGDMSGDVFGNGTLLSKQIRLIAAFDHRHVFIDPNPDTAASWAERERLFRLPGSSWNDYDRKALSEGGRIYPRSAKSVQLSPQARDALQVDSDTFTPAELIQAILRAPADLLWNGGIGTYIKASTESHTDVGDRANDAVRVDATELRCRVVGEGGNLGVTQLGRIEYALAGGRINTDAIDNVGGVDCSDHEVNIKILLNDVVERGELTERQRSRLLADMTEEVAELVLTDNYRQTEALSIMEARSGHLLSEHIRLIRELERQGRIRRQLDGLPSDQQLQERANAGRGLTRPEAAVLLAYAKLTCFEALVGTDLPDDQDLRHLLLNYFPGPLRERYAALMSEHRLSREIVATQVTNELFNHMGASFVFRMQEASSGAVDAVARAFFMTRGIFRLDAIWEAIDALDTHVPEARLTLLRLQVLDVAEDTALWLMRHPSGQHTIATTIQRLSEPIRLIDSQLDTLLPTDDQRHLARQVESHISDGVPEQLALEVARLDALSAALDIAQAATETGVELTTAADVYFRLAGLLGLRWLGNAIEDVPTSDLWHERCRIGLHDDLGRQRRLLATAVLRTAADDNPASIVDAWSRRFEGPFLRFLQVMLDLHNAGQPDVAMLTVALQELKNLVTMSGQSSVDRE
ncbi:MAG: NAD-glutamate dehydrogenase [Aquisalimonadaceae bacterium]